VELDVSRQTTLFTRGRRECNGDGVKRKASLSGHVLPTMDEGVRPSLLNRVFIKLFLYMFAK
jgi:hypothetical protein